MSCPHIYATNSSSCEGKRPENNLATREPSRYTPTAIQKLMSFHPLGLPKGEPDFSTKMLRLSPSPRLISAFALSLGWMLLASFSHRPDCRNRSGWVHHHLLPEQLGYAGLDSIHPATNVCRLGRIDCRQHSDGLRIARLDDESIRLRAGLPTEPLLRAGRSRRDHEPERRSYLPDHGEHRVHFHRRYDER